MRVPSWLRTPSVISLGLCVARQIFNPNLRPSFAMSSKASSLAKVSSLPIDLPMKLCASSKKTTIGLFEKVPFLDSFNSTLPMQLAIISRALYSNGIPLRSILINFLLVSVATAKRLKTVVKGSFVVEDVNNVLKGGE